MEAIQMNKKRRINCPFDLLSTDELFLIFLLLDTEDLMSAFIVCKRWKLILLSILPKKKDLVFHTEVSHKHYIDNFASFSSNTSLKLSYNPSEVFLHFLLNNPGKWLHKTLNRVVLSQQQLVIYPNNMLLHTIIGYLKDSANFKELQVVKTHMLIHTGITFDILPDCIINGLTVLNLKGLLLHSFSQLKFSCLPHLSVLKVAFVNYDSNHIDNSFLALQLQRISFTCPQSQLHPSLFSHASLAQVSFHELIPPTDTDIVLMPQDSLMDNINVLLQFFYRNWPFVPGKVMLHIDDGITTFTPDTIFPVLHTVALPELFYTISVFFRMWSCVGYKNLSLSSSLSYMMDYMLIHHKNMLDAYYQMIVNHFNVQ